ncbi:MAG: family 20 glycosylhydrolase, partial [Lentisphaeria bacterium]|nr:family 20 glycosylhydrolase [Lentisphaeria bacterium]
MEIKAVHFDMKSMIPTAEYALTLVDEIAELGINALLVEFEDKFPFDVTEGIHHPCAWTKDEFRAFAKRCKERNIELIPLLQSIGHLDYLLKYPKFRNLRDGGPEGSSYQWCLAIEESYELWCAMVEELLEVFPETTIFHIGADECRMNVPCELCEENRLDLYVKRVARCCEYIQKKNMKVVVWDDVFRKYGEEKFALLPKGVISCVWMYSKLDEEYIDRMVSSGVECWGASCIQAHKFFHAMSPQEPKMRNVDAWGKIHQKYPQMTGHIGTIWGRNQCQSPFNSNLPQSMFMTAYLVETLENGIIEDRKKFITDFGRKFFGMDLDYNTMINYFCYEPGYSEPIVTEL